MANYNKYINTFSGATDVQEWGAYIASEYAGFPNVAYLETSDMVKYRKVSSGLLSVGSIYYSDGTATGPNDAVDTTKTPIGVVVVDGMTTGEKNGSFDVYIMALNLISSGSTATTPEGFQAGTFNNSIQLSRASDTLIHLSGSTQNDFTGKRNTDYLVNNPTLLPWVVDCVNVANTAYPQCEWFVPSTGEIYNIIANKTVINASLQKLRTAFGNTFCCTIPNGTDYDSGRYYWIVTSCEYNASKMRTIRNDEPFNSSDVSKTGVARVLMFGIV